MKKRLKEMEDEAAALREMQTKVEQEMGAVQGCTCPYPLYHVVTLGFVVSLVSAL